MAQVSMQMKIGYDTLAIGVVFFTAPIGKALLPGFPGESLRFFYLLCPLSILMLVQYRQSTAIVLPLLAYNMVCAISILISLDSLNPNVGFAGHPMVRLVVHSSIMSCFILAGWRTLSCGTDKAWHYVTLVFQGFMVVLILGYILYFGTTAGAIPRPVYEAFNILTQAGYGVLRFNPGSYPNEFGTMASFFSVSAIFLLLAKSQRFPRRFLYAMGLLAFVAMALATTRAAYLAFAVSLVYVFWTFKAGQAIKAILSVFTVSALALFFMPKDILEKSINVLDTAYQSAVSGTGSISKRYEAWDTALPDFIASPYWGLGFEFPSVSGLHNTYLQFLFGLGFIGFFACAAILLSIAFMARQKFSIVRTNFYDRDLHTITVIAFIHVASFALSNHNQNHFLTWFCAYLIVVTGALSSSRKATQNQTYNPNVGSLEETQV